MSFSYLYRTLKIGNTYKLHARPEMFGHDKETLVEGDTDADETDGKTRTRFSSVMVEYKIKTNFEPLYDQISTPTNMMERPI